MSEIAGCVQIGVVKTRIGCTKQIKQHEQLNITQVVVRIEQRSHCLVEMLGAKLGFMGVITVSNKSSQFIAVFPLIYCRNGTTQTRFFLLLKP